MLQHPMSYVNLEKWHLAHFMEALHEELLPFAAQLFIANIRTREGEDDKRFCFSLSDVRLSSVLTS